MNKIIINEIKPSKRNYIGEWFLRMIGYTLVLILMSILFPKTVYIDSSYFWVWGILAVIIINILNMFIKPILIVMTLPITIITLGLFYPLINVIILYLADFILGVHFELGNIFMVLIVAVVISIMNSFIDQIVDNRIEGRR